MSSVLTTSILMLTILGVVLAVILYVVAQKFKVEEDPRIDEVEALLPGANCGGCGYPGCRGLADALVKADDISAISCPVGGNETMRKVAAILGKAVESTLYSGDTGCQFGCLGLGDCVAVCKFDAIYIDPVSLLPVIDEEKCTACGACVKACPKLLIELRKKGPKGKRIFVSCMNTDKGGVARKYCSVACIGCFKCVKVCPYEAITLENNLAYIDANKCKLCRKCVEECPTDSILEVNFPPRKPKVEEQAQNAVTS